MSTKQVKTPADRGQSERPKLFAQSEFLGNVKGLPLSEIGDSNVYRYDNFIGFGKRSQGRPGTRRVSKAVIPDEGPFTAVALTDLLTINGPTEGHHFLDGDKVKVSTTGTLPAPLIPGTTYYVIYVNDVDIQLATTYQNAIDGVLIDITTAGVGTHYIRYAADIGAVLDHHKEERVVKLYGRRVYVAQRNLESYEQVINLESVVPTGIGRMIENDSNVTLAAGPIFRIVLDGDFYYMYRLNASVPQIIITDVNEQAGIREHGYRYYYSCARIEGTGNRNRVTADALLVLETGTCKDENEEQQFGEVFFASAIGVDVTQDHVIGTLTLPIANQSISHYPLYRTKNFGTNTGGEGVNKAYFVYADDVPVCKAFNITVVGNIATIVPGQNEFVQGDVGCTLRTDDAGTRTAVIDTYTDPNNVILVGGHTLLAAEEVAIGGGRVMTASQTGLLITRTAHNTFVRADEGRTFYWGNGEVSVIRRWIDANNVEAAFPNTIAAMAGTIQLNAGTRAFYRNWNDTIQDDGDAVGEVGLQERILSQQDLYIPLFNYRPIPLSDIVITSDGFSIFAIRDGVDYWYSNIGAKDYSEGQYRIEQQFGKLIDPVREIKVMPGMAIFITPTRTYNMNLNVPINNVGEESVGEFIQKLTEPAEVDGDIGVIHWQTIRKVNASLFIAVTSEPAVRLFNGQSWGEVNLAIEQNGDEAVMVDLNKMDSFYNLIAWFSYLSGYKIRASKWEDA